jgi:hypothetical protein
MKHHKLLGYIILLLLTQQILKPSETKSSCPKDEHFYAFFMCFL